MKKKLLLGVLLLICSLGSAQIVIENPKNGSSDYFGNLVKIELNDSQTIFQFEKKTIDSVAYKLNKNFFIQTEIDTSRFFLLSVQNIKEKPNKENGYTYDIEFPAIHKDAKIISIYYEKEPIGSWNVLQREYVRLLSNIEINAKIDSEITDKTFSKYSFKRTLSDSKNQNKDILLYFTADWCLPCKSMEKYIFTHKEVHNAITSNFISLKVDIDSQKGESLRQKYSGEGVPYFYILNSDGEILKEKLGAMYKSQLLDFLIVDSSIQPIKPNAKKKKEVNKDKGIGLRLGLLNNRITNLSNSNSKIGITIDALFSIDYNRRYLLRSGIGFSSKGNDDLNINYLRIPVEFGYSVYKGSIFNLPGAVRLIGAPYYAIRLNKNEKGLSNNDYGVRFGISPHIGDFNELEFEIYYEHGMNDLFKSVNGKQHNKSFGLSFSLNL